MLSAKKGKKKRIIAAEYKGFENEEKLITSSASGSKPKSAIYPRTDVVKNNTVDDGIELSASSSAAVRRIEEKKPLTNGKNHSSDSSILVSPKKLYGSFINPEHSDEEENEIQEAKDIENQIDFNTIAGIKKLLKDGSEVAIKNELETKVLENKDGTLTIITDEMEIKEDDKVKSRMQFFTTKAMFEKFDEKEQNQLLTFYANLHPREYYTILVHALLGYLGEIFYLYWDFAARIEIIKTLFPGIPDDDNFIAQVIATVPIAAANITYNPLTTAKGYVRSKLLDPEHTVIAEMFHNKIIALLFLLYCLAGGYIEIVEIDSWLDETMGMFKLAPIGILVYAAVAYYVAYQFKDTVKGIKDFGTVLTNLKFSDIKNASDLSTAGFVSGHMLIALIERMFRMSYGGFMAGTQQMAGLGSTLSWTIGASLASLIGLATIPVALGTRCMSAFHKYFPEKTHIAYEVAKAIFKQRYNASLASSAWYEAKLFFTPTLLALAPLAYITYQGAANDAIPYPYRGLSGAGSAIAATLITHISIARPAAERVLVTEIANEDVKPEVGEIQPNFIASSSATIACFTDNLSRTLTMGVVLLALFPALFPREEENHGLTREGLERLLSALCLVGFILMPSYYYQAQKCAVTYAESIPTLFGTKRRKEIEVKEVEVKDVALTHEIVEHEIVEKKDEEKDSSDDRLPNDSIVHVASTSTTEEKDENNASSASSPSISDKTNPKHPAFNPFVSASADPNTLSSIDGLYNNDNSPSSSPTSPASSSTTSSPTQTSPTSSLTGTGGNTGLAQLADEYGMFNKRKKNRLPTRKPNEIVTSSLPTMRNNKEENTAA